jgi:hypothetical protein
MTTNIAVVDAETDPFEYGADIKPFLWGFFDGKNYYQTESTEEMVNHISKFDGTVFAHNGGKFDYFFMLPFIKKDQAVKVINGRLSEFKIGRARMRDSLNILPVGLAKFQKDDFEYWKMKADRRRFHWKEIEVYLKSDCVNLHNVVTRFIADYGLSLTLAGAAMKQWKKLGNKVSTTSEEFYNRYAPYYFGGRVECFESGVFKEDFRIVDINSAYPSLMMQDHPTGTKIIESRRIDEKTLFKSFVTLECYSYGALPYRVASGKERGNVEFPHRRDVYHCTGRELKGALETNTVKNISIKKVITFQETVNFTEYIEKFFAIKLSCEKSGDDIGRTMAKFFLNSLYGKFCANPNKYNDFYIGDWGQKPPEGFGVGPLIEDVQFFSKPIDDAQKTWYNVATGASITGGVRAFLWESIQRVERPMYCDTDSIICKGVGDLALSDKIGDWSNEGCKEGANKLAIAGKKLYCAWMKNGKKKLATKGVKLTSVELEKVARGETITYYSNSPTYSLSKGVYYTKRNVKPTV